MVPGNVRTPLSKYFEILGPPLKYLDRVRSAYCSRVVINCTENGSARFVRSWDDMVYDSLNKCLTTSTELQIASIVNTSQPKISIEFVDVQKQCGSSDCGVYAIAYATALSLAQDPGTLVCSQSEVRRHLFKMLKEKKLTVLKKKWSVRVTEGYPILVYCSCRMLEVGDMIECSNCEEWFHVPSCSSPTQVALSDTTSLWFCNN